MFRPTLVDPKRKPFVFENGGEYRFRYLLIANSSPAKNAIIAELPNYGSRIKPGDLKEDQTVANTPYTNAKGWRLNVEEQRIPIEDATHQHLIVARALTTRRIKIFAEISLLVLFSIGAVVLFL